MRTQLAKCRRCGKLFTRERGDLCGACKQEETREVEKVKNFLELHKDAGPGKVTEKTGVALEEVFRFAKEGLIAASEYANIRYPCEICRDPIASGRFCKKCNSHLAEEFEKTVEKMREEGRTG